jgi:hypothetical protein
MIWQKGGSSGESVLEAVKGYKAGKYRCLLSVPKDEPGGTTGTNDASRRF